VIRPTPRRCLAMWVALEAVNGLGVANFRNHQL
jgi:hypothetical protein